MSQAQHHRGGLDRDPTLADVEAVAGAEAARRLAEAFGGRRLYLPREPGPHHPISACLGHAAALELCRAIGGFPLDVPLGAGRRAEILRLKAEGLGPLEIQRRVKCSRSTVFKVLREARAEETPRLL